MVLSVIKYLRPDYATKAVSVPIRISANSRTISSTSTGIGDRATQLVIAFSTVYGPLHVLA
jgi:hypothetical protein